MKFMSISTRQAIPLQTVYLAARFARQVELKQIAAELEAAGVKVTSRWLDEQPLENDELDSDGRGGLLAQMDLEDLSSASVCIAFSEGTDGPRGRGGRHTELGIALALGKRVILVGPREHVFHCLPTVEHYADWETARVDLHRDLALSPIVRGESRRELSALH